MNPVESLRFFIPELILLAGAFLVLFLDFFVQNKKALGLFSLAVLAAAAVAGPFPQNSYPLFYGFFLLDPFTYFFRLIAIGGVAITILNSLNYKPLHKNYEGEYYSLFLFMAFALILAVSSINLLMIFIAIEFISLLSYLLVGFLKKDGKSKEAAVKYLLFGAVASGVMLYGMSLLFGATGSLDILLIEQILPQTAFIPVAIVAALFMFVGLGFKVSMAPFHLWAPDVYEGAPTPVTAFLTVAPKALGFSVLIRILSTVFFEFGAQWGPLISVLAMLTMTLGNVTAIAQHNIKRLLAYSSIAQAGYILMGLAVFSEVGITGVLIYLLAYVFTNLGIFSCVLMASHSLESDDMHAYAGLSRRSPLLAASLTIFLLSLAGIPPLAGFIGKFFVFSAAIQAGFNLLAIVAAINSAVAAYYYFKIVRLMYLVPATEDTPIASPLSYRIALGLMLVGTIAMGVAASPFINFVKAVLAV